MNDQYAVTRTSGTIFCISCRSVSVVCILTDKRALAHVAYVDPANPLLCGIGLEKAQNIWGVPSPPDDWQEGDF